MKTTNETHYVLELAGEIEVAAGNTKQRIELGDHLHLAGLMILAASELRELHRTGESLRESMMRQLRAVDPEPAGDELDAAPLPPPAGGARCRHTWSAGPASDGTTRCIKCGAPKGKQGRKPAAAPTATAAGVTKIDPPSLPLPAPPEAPHVQPMGAVTANRFKDGPI